ncbi:MAG: hypothetical protein ABIK23_02880 [candidate division WOR-3 bacterium]
MDRRTGKVCLVIFLVFLPGITNARILNVPEYPYTTIQSAIDAANDGDTISVWCESVRPAFTMSISSATRACLLSTEVFCQDEVERNLSRRLVIGE